MGSERLQSNNVDAWYVHSITPIIFQICSRAGIALKSGGSRISQREGAQTPWGGGGRQHTILPNFPENCMKLKEFGCLGGGGGKEHSCTLLGPANGSVGREFAYGVRCLPSHQYLHPKVAGDWLGSQHGCQEVSRYRTRGTSQGICNMYASAKCK